MTDAPPPRPDPSIAPAPPAAAWTPPPDHSGAWAGAWIVVYGTIAVCWWTAHALLLALIERGATAIVRLLEVAQSQNADDANVAAVADLVTRIPEASGKPLVPYLIGATVVAAAVAFAGFGVMARSRAAHATAVAGLVALLGGIAGFAIHGVRVTHAARDLWKSRAAALLDDLAVAGHPVDAEIRSMLASDGDSAAVGDVCLASFHAAVVGLLLWALLRRRTRAWCA